MTKCQQTKKLRDSSKRRTKEETIKTPEIPDEESGFFSGDDEDGFWDRDGWILGERMP